MRAVVLHQIGSIANLRVEEMPTPQPGAGEVCVALQAAALNHREIWICVGRYPEIKLPCILGADGAGVVMAVGAGVSEDLIGSEVVLYPALNWGKRESFPGADFRVRGMPDPGTFAQYSCATASDVYPKPPHLDWQQAAALPLAGLTAWRATTTQAQVSRGERVLITGIGGGVATLALQWAVALGAEVFVTSGNDEKIEAAKAMGAADGVNYRGADWDRDLQDLSGGVDVIIDGTGGDTFPRCFGILKGGGRFVIYGATRMNPSEPLQLARWFFRQARLQGTTMGSNKEFGDMLAFCERHRIEPRVDRVFDLSDVVAAHERMERSAQMGKIVLRIR